MSEVEQPYNASDPEQINLARKKYSRKKAGHLQVLKALMELADGRMFVYELLEFCHMYQSSFMQGDPYSTAFREGERNVGLRLTADIMSAAPNDYVKMLQEAKNRS